MWDGYLQSRIAIVWKDFDRLHFKIYSELAENNWFQSWDVTFHRLTFAKAVMQLMNEDISYNIHVLGIDTNQTTLEDCDVEGWKFFNGEVVSLRQKINDIESTLQESQMAMSKLGMSDG